MYVFAATLLPPVVIKTTAAPTTAPDGCDLADIVILMDTSGSVGLKHWRIMINFIEGMVDALHISAQHTQVKLLIVFPFSLIHNLSLLV